MARLVVPCNLCGTKDFSFIFSKESSKGDVYEIQECKRCGLVQVSPQPDLDEVRPYYEKDYFEKRTDRGYANYYSTALKEQIQNVYTLNLRDLGYFEIEQQLPKKKTAIDLGCAAGYFVEYLQDRGWKSEGIEISKAAAKFGIKTLGLNIHVGDFFSHKKLKRNSYDLVTLWASLEHMHDPKRVLSRCFEMLKPNGTLILSTLRYGWLAKLQGIKWRYMNVPEHLYFFSLEDLQEFAEQAGFTWEKHISYGSGLTTRANASVFYKWAKKCADPLVKKFDQGDMVAVRLSKC